MIELAYSVVDITGEDGAHDGLVVGGSFLAVIPDLIRDPGCSWHGLRVVARNDKTGAAVVGR